MDGMMIPFIMLLIVTIALVLERKHHEDKIVDIYEEKFKEWKQHASVEGKEEEPKPKELVGLVFIQDHQLSIEVTDKRAINPLERKKYQIKS